MFTHFPLLLARLTEEDVEMTEEAVLLLTNIGYVVPPAAGRPHWHRH
jgi:hypothetical protein